MKQKCSSYVIWNSQTNCNVEIYAKEQSAKFIKELNRFNITQNNSLLTTQWDNFYKHIDLSFDNFYTLLKDNFSDLNEKELQLCCMMVAGFKTEEIAAIWMQSIFLYTNIKPISERNLKLLKVLI